MCFLFCLLDHQLAAKSQIPHSKNPLPSWNLLTAGKRLHKRCRKAHVISRFLPSEATSSRSSSVSSLFSSLLSTLYTTTTAAEISTRKQLHTNTATRYLGTVASENLPLSESLYLPSLLDECLVTSRSRRLSILTYVRLRTQRTPTSTIVTKRETIKKTQTQKQKQNKNKTKSPNYQKKVDVSSVLSFRIVRFHFIPSQPCLT